MTDTGHLCGAHVWRCSRCSNAVAPSRVRRGDGCPRTGCDGVGVVEGSCERRVANGNVRCYRHGAAIPAARQAADERRLEADVVGLLADYPVRPVHNPLEALKTLIGETVALKDALFDRIGNLEDLTNVDTFQREDVRALVAAYERSLDRCGKLLGDAARLKLDERLVAIDEKVADRVLALLEMAMVASIPADLHDPLKRAFADVVDGRTPPQLAITIPSAPVRTGSAGAEGQDMVVYGLEPATLPAQVDDEPPVGTQEVTEPPGTVDDTAKPVSEPVRAVVPPPKRHAEVRPSLSSRNRNQGPEPEPGTYLSVDMWKGLP